MSKPVLEDLFSFEGRRNRRSYVLYAISLIPALVFTALISETMDSRLVFALLLTPIYVSGWAVGSQRLRDINFSGWWVLVTLIPILGIFFTVFVALQPGTEGPNRFGPDPLAGSDSPSRW